MPTQGLPDTLRALEFPFPEPPAPGAPLEVAEGVLWARVPLPYQLDHVNIFLVRDGTQGWVAIDTGIRTDAAVAAWQQLFDGPLKGERLSRILVTHFHPDHVGLAGWLCETFDAPLLTSLSTYMTTQVISAAQKESTVRNRFDFYVMHGMSEAEAGVVAIQGGDYLTRVAPLPDSYLRLLAGDQLQIGDRSFRVLSGDGHAPEQIMLYCGEDRLLFAADQVLERISPNVSVFPGEPDGDPLGHFLRGLRLMRSDIPGDVLVLPGHRRPFRGLHRRSLELELHHEDRCDQIRAACARAPHTVAQLVPVVFPRKLDAHQMGFAFTETLAHVNRLRRRGELTTRADANGILSIVPA